MGVRWDREIKEEHDKDCVDEGFQLTRAKLEGGGGGGMFKYTGTMLQY